jgi:hypothetical protein
MLSTHIPRARRSLFRLAAALGLGLGLLAASATSTSAMNCGEIEDPFTGAVIELPCLVEDRYLVEPEPCLCPFVDQIDESWRLTVDEPRYAAQSAFVSRLDMVALNPQPLPPKAIGFFR